MLKLAAAVMVRVAKVSVAAWTAVSVRIAASAVIVRVSRVVVKESGVTLLWRVVVV